jgi:hypothetical protein
MPLQSICCHPDATGEEKTGYSTVNEDVITTVFTNQFWQSLDQLIRIAKPLVDAIGNLESRDCTLADCLLEMIRCARIISEMKLQDGDDPMFLEHTKRVLNKRFRHMNTLIHSLALFLHPLCRKLAISNESGGRDFTFMTTTALELAKQWNWPKEKVLKLVENLKDYSLCKSPFEGGDKNGLGFWENLRASGDKVPLKTMAITLFRIVPHSADVERLFSDLGGVQAPKRCNLSIPTFRDLGKIGANLKRHYHNELRAQGIPVRRTHGHMHSKSAPGIDVEIVNAIMPTEQNDAHWTPPLVNNNTDSGQSNNAEENVEESMRNLEEELAAEDSINSDLQLADADVLDGKLYDFDELERIDKGIALTAFNEEIEVVGDSQGSATWKINDILRQSGV